MICMIVKILLFYFFDSMSFCLVLHDQTYALICSVVVTLPAFYFALPDFLLTVLSQTSQWLFEWQLSVPDQAMGGVDDSA